MGTLILLVIMMTVNHREKEQKVKGNLQTKEDLATAVTVIRMEIEEVELGMVLVVEEELAQII